MSTLSTTKQCFFLLFTSLKNFSTHPASLSGPITELRASRNSSKLIPCSPLPSLFPPLHPFHPLSCVCTLELPWDPLSGDARLANASLRSCKCSRLIFSSGLTPQPGSLQRGARPWSNKFGDWYSIFVCWVHLIGSVCPCSILLYNLLKGFLQMNAALPSGGTRTTHIQSVGEVRHNYI